MTKFRLEYFLLILVLYSILLQQLPKTRIELHTIACIVLVVFAFLSCRCWSIEPPLCSLSGIGNACPVPTYSPSCTFLHNIALFEPIGSLTSRCKSRISLGSHAGIQICHIRLVVTSKVRVLILILVILRLRPSTLDLLAQVQWINALTKQTASRLWVFTSVSLFSSSLHVHLFVLQDLCSSCSW